MFGSLGLPEIILILVIALLVFGPKRLPEVGRTIGRGLAEFRRASTDLKRSVNAELSLEEEDERSSSSRRPSHDLPGVGRTSREASSSPDQPAEDTPGARASAAADAGDYPPTAPPGTAPRGADPVPPAPEEERPAGAGGDDPEAAEPAGTAAGGSDSDSR